ncbi:hypothetical protein BRN38_04975, partial [Xanthomonas oryzae pv. oryzae]
MCRRSTCRRSESAHPSLATAVDTCVAPHPSRTQHRMPGEPMSVPARTQTSSIAPSRVRSLLIIAVGLFAADGVWA